RLEPAATLDTGVAEPHIDPAPQVTGRRHQLGDSVFGRRVAAHCLGTDLPGDLLRGPGVDVVDQYPAPLGGQPGGQRPADAVARAGDDHPLPGHHMPLPVSVTPPSTTSTCPVIHTASSDSRNATTLPTSSGTPSRLSG